MIELRPYQAELLADVSARFREGNRSVLIQSATGSGKTAIAIKAAEKAASRGKRVLFQAHTRVLVRQTVAKFNDAGIEVGILMAGHEGSDRLIQIGSIQTLCRRLDKVHPFDLIITDECRRATSASYQKVLGAWPRAYHIGLDATPCRADGRGLGSIYTAMACGPSIKWLIENGHLAPFVVYAPTTVDISSTRTVGGDFSADDVAEAMDKPVIIGDGVDHYKRIASDRRAITYCATIKHARDVADGFNAAGVPSAVLHSELTDGEQLAAIEGIGNGAIRNLVSVGMVNDGFDVPGVTCAILLRHTKSLSLASQQWGRANRGGGGPPAIVLDHVGNVLRHGLPEAERVWSLDGVTKKKRKDGESKIVTRLCKECFAHYQPWLKKCPHCGAGAEKSARIMEQVDGELAEVTSEDDWRERVAAMPYSRATSELTTPEDVREYALAKKYKPGWAIRQLVEKGFSIGDACRALGYDKRTKSFKVA